MSDSMDLSVVGIVVSLLLVVTLALRGWHIILVAPLAVVVVALFSGMNVLALLTGPYMKGFVNYASKFYLVFLSASVFGKTMEDSGAARAIALARAAAEAGSAEAQAMLGCLLGGRKGMLWRWGNSSLGSGSGSVPIRSSAFTVIWLRIVTFSSTVRSSGVVAATTSRSQSAGGRATGRMCGGVDLTVERGPTARRRTTIALRQERPQQTTFATTRTAMTVCSADSISPTALRF